MSPLLVIGIGAPFYFKGSFTLGGLIAFNAVIGYVLVLIPISRFALSDHDKVVAGTGAEGLQLP